ncbi:MAG: Maleamate amidohydrolase [Alphaproteobacteria bacterium MarineAlpha11_Bin1]|nr:MAG: Maleamate amidohydrolase [Alphaproteobacteria bacterium MarineAlpha11_Bin1]|tara:strand:+ start:6700 stop:7377 length:678 start_codon:yes stop_codon:yes gene_type:complete
MRAEFEDHCWADIMSEEILKIYEPYHREVYVGDRPALLAIDLYNLVYRGGEREPHEIVDEFPSTCGRYAWEAIEPTKRLFSTARSVGIPVMYTTAPATSDVVATNRQDGLGTTDNDYEIFDAFAPQEGDVMIVKQRASAFFGTPILPELNRLGVNSLIVCGESTSGCVRASAVDAYSAGFHVSIAEECVFDRSILSHKVNLFDLHHKYADVIPTLDIISHLESAR